MNKPRKSNHRRYVLAEVTEQYTEAVGGERVVFEAKDGTELTFPHPLLAEDEWSEAVDDAENSRDKAIAILGEEQYEKYKAAGHRDHEIGFLVMEVQRNSQAALKKRPTRS